MARRKKQNKKVFLFAIFSNRKIHFCILTAFDCNIENSKTSHTTKAHPGGISSKLADDCHVWKSKREREY